MIFPGCTFEIQRKGPRYRSNAGKLRLTIDKVEPPLDAGGPLYFDLGKSRVHLPGAEMEELAKIEEPVKVEEPPEEVIPQKQGFQLEADGIGGLTEQIDAINAALVSFDDPGFVLEDYHLIGPTSILLHGAEGTGKTLLLEKLCQCPWSEVIKLDQDSKVGPKALSELFENARNAQPSLITIDDLDKFLTKNETTRSRLQSELKSLEGSRVLVAATARSIYDIDTSLRTPSAFKLELELFPPNVKQREDILRQILGAERTVADVDYASLAEKTHGFVGRDIHKLCSLARNLRVQRVYQSLEADKRSSFREVLKEVDFVKQEEFNAVIGEVQPTVLKDSVLEVPKVYWTDIAGVDHVRKLLEAITVRPFKVRAFLE